MSPAQVLSLDLRRASDGGDLKEILRACEEALASAASVALTDQVHEVLYEDRRGLFWLIAEDASLFDRLCLLDARLN